MWKILAFEEWIVVCVCSHSVQRKVPKFPKNKYNLATRRRPLEIDRSSSRWWWCETAVLLLLGEYRRRRRRRQARGYALFSQIRQTLWRTSAHSPYFLLLRWLQHYQQLCKLIASGWLVHISSTNAAAAQSLDSSQRDPKTISDEWKRDFERNSC